MGGGLDTAVGESRWCRVPHRLALAGGSGSPYFYGVLCWAKENSPGRLSLFLCWFPLGVQRELPGRAPLSGRELQDWNKFENTFGSFSSSEGDGLRKFLLNHNDCEHPDF